MSVKRIHSIMRKHTAAIVSRRETCVGNGGTRGEDSLCRVGGRTGEFDSERFGEVNHVTIRIPSHGLANSSETRCRCTEGTTQPNVTDLSITSVPTLSTSGNVESTKI